MYFPTATLTPTEYFADILGGGADSVQAMFGSPFPPENLCISVADQLSTRFGDRDKTCRAVVSYIAAAVSAKPGNYLVYLQALPEGGHGGTDAAHERGGAGGVHCLLPPG